MTTPTRKADADALVAEVRAAYRRGALRVGFSIDNVVAMLAVGPAATLLGWVPKTDAQRTLEKQLKELAGHIATWETRYRMYAERGSTDSGAPYSWQKWEDYARSPLKQYLKDLVDESVSESLFGRFVTEVVVKTGKDAAEVATTAANPLSWPTWAKVAAAGGGLVLVLAIAAPYVTPFLPRRS